MTRRSLAYCLLAFALASCGPNDAVQSAAAALSAPQATDDLPFRDPALNIDTRIDDLLSRLTLDEKIAFLHQYQPAIPRLNIQLFKTGTEALHGLAWSNDYDNAGQVVTATATVFPQAIGLGSTWDASLLRDIGETVGIEARAAHANNPRVWGLNLWAPVVNLLRDPRWGRNEGGYSEDPLLTSQLAIAYTHGMAGDDPDHLLTAPTLKHFLAYNNEVRRDTTSSSISARVLREYDLQAFEPALRAGYTSGLMPSYNLVNGRPMHVSAELLDLARSFAREPLFIVSDAYAPYNLSQSQAYYPTKEQGHAAALLAGLDSYTIDNNNSASMAETFRNAIAMGLVNETDVEQAVRHALGLRFRLGELDAAGSGPYDHIDGTYLNRREHGELARKAASSAMVLLKNQDQLLPLAAERTHKLALIGPLAQTVYTDWYSGALPYAITPARGIAERAGSGTETSVVEGCNRIALRSLATGQYVSASQEANGNVLRVGASSAGVPEAFDVTDWGEGIVTLRAAANGRFVGRDPAGQALINRDVQPNGWFVMQQFKLLRQPDASYVIQYAGYETRESWFGDKTYVLVDDAGQLQVQASNVEQASKFNIELLTDGLSAARSAAAGADAAIVVVGSMPFINGRENRDRQDLQLAAGQLELVRTVLEANPRTLLVLENSYPTAINWEQDHVPAILWTSHAGQELGHALADVVFGDVSPAGRLPQTWHRSASELPDILDYDIIGSDRTYQYFAGQPLYAFGHGLSYTRFEYSKLRVQRMWRGSQQQLLIDLDVKNVGTRTSDEVVQLYTRQQRSRVKQPQKRLRAFERLHAIAAGDRRHVQFELPMRELAIWDVTRGRNVVERSAYDILVGAASDDIRVQTELFVNGEVVPPRNLARAVRAENYDATLGTKLVDESRERGTALGFSAAGTWVEYRGVRARGCEDTLTLTAAKEAQDVGSLSVRLGDPVSGTLVATLPLPATGDRYRYASVSTTAKLTPGIHDLYVTYDGTSETRLSSLQLTCGANHQ